MRRRTKSREIDAGRLAGIELREVDAVVEVKSHVLLARVVLRSGKGQWLTSGNWQPELQGRSDRTATESKLQTFIPYLGNH